MGTKAFGNIPEKVHRLAEILTKKFEKSLVAHTPELNAEMDELFEKLKAEGFEVAVVAVKDPVTGDVTEMKLAVYRIGTELTVH